MAKKTIDKTELKKQRSNPGFSSLVLFLVVLLLLISLLRRSFSANGEKAG